MAAPLWVCVVVLGTITLASGAGLRPDHDFEFDEDAEGRRPRRYLYDPHNALCRSLVCKKREVCVLRDAFTALCANKKELLRRGDSVVAVSGADSDDDVFYEDGAREADLEPPTGETPDKCVSCETHTRGEFLCGSDNRTYSSLCRLDLHNCVHKKRRPVALACRGFCPCRAPSHRRTSHRPRPRRPRPHPSRNEVVPAHGPRCALDEMANRLLDWFSVLMEEAGASAETPPSHGFPQKCKAETRWMFAHLDTDGDGLLTASELYALRHDDRERCLRPFLSSCGTGGAGDAVSKGGWCGCLRRAARPCTALARAHPDPHPGAYVPTCDDSGFYRPRQCHSALGVCWCVDPHGVELPGSRGKGAPACPPGVEAGAPADDEDAAGSGDSDLRY